MKTEKFNKDAGELADAISKGIASMLWDRHMVTLTPDAQKDVGTLVMMNVPAIITLLQRAE